MKLYNTATQQKEEVAKRNEPVTIYTCGPTVYLDPHIGNWRMFIFYDTLVRSLKFLGYQTKHVINITDVGHLVSDADEGQDKLAMQAQREKKTAWDIAQFYTDRYLQGRDALNMLHPDVMPKATETIQEQIDLVKLLEEKGITYKIDDGIYFDISRFTDYGKMARLSLEGQRSGARVDENTEKRQPQDFALWKFSPKDEKRDMEWESPWGIGFPGWHLECSAMAKAFLGDTIDIHAGGIDHIPVHHTNEIAQSETANEAQYARCWSHGGFMLVDGTKMSKSLGNVFTLDDIDSHKFTPLAFRLMVLQSHYRSESNFTWEGLAGAQSRLQSLLQFAALRWQPQENGVDIALQCENALKDVTEALEDDINTPRVLEIISKLQEISAAGITQASVDPFIALLEGLDAVLGLNLLEQTPDISPEQKEQILSREQSRRNREFEASDTIRDELSAAGLLLNDTPDYSLWHYK